MNEQPGVKRTGHFILTPLGSAGDVHPLAIIGRRLMRRGFRVTVLTNPLFQSLVEQLGLEFVPIGTKEDLLEAGRSKQLFQLSSAWKVALKWGALGTMREQYQAIADRFVPGESVLVAPGMAFGSRIARERLGIPLATVHLDPGNLRSVFQSPRLPRPLVLEDWVPKWNKRLQFRVADRLVIDRLLQAETNAFRGELGLAPVRRLLHHWWHSPDLVLGLFPEWYAPRQPDWPTAFRQTDFPRWDPPGKKDRSEDADSFLTEGSPPIVFLPGSAGPQAKRYFETAVTATAQVGRRAILLSKQRQLIPAALPSTIRHFEYLPLKSLLARSALLVHHGGIGTVAQALAAGVPQLVVPGAFNQVDEARRLSRLGVARTIFPKRFQPQRVASELAQLLEDERYTVKCRELATRLQSEQTLLETCNHLQSLLGRQVDFVAGTPPRN